MAYRRSTRFVLSLVVWIGLVVIAGCGSRGTVKGKVTHKGKSVVWGSVSLIASDNIQYAGRITPEGTYSIPSVPNGPVKIAVTSPNPDSANRAGGSVARGGTARGKGGSGDSKQVAPPPGAWFAIPEKYGDPQQSGLTGTVRSKTTIDLDLP